MENMIQYAAQQTPAPAVLDFSVVLAALGLATEEPAAEQPVAPVENSLSIEFDDGECEAFEVERNGVIALFMKNQQVWCTVTDSRGGHAFTAKMTRVFFVNKEGGFIGETAILPVVDRQEVADALVWRGGVVPEGDIVTILDWEF